MLSSTSLFSSSRPVAPHAQLRPPWPLASPARLPRLSLPAPDRRLALDSVNLNALFIHLRINSHPSKPLRGSVTVSDQSLGKGGAAWLSLRLAREHAALPICERSGRVVRAEARGGRGWRSQAERRSQQDRRPRRAGGLQDRIRPLRGEGSSKCSPLETPRGRRKCRDSGRPGSRVHTHCQGRR